MSKRETIDKIMARNPSAKPEFLAEFSEEDLGAYLRQLESVGDESHLAGPAAVAHPWTGSLTAPADACLGG